MRTVASTYLKTVFEACVQQGCPADKLAEYLPDGQSVFENPLLRVPCEVLIDLLWQAEKMLGTTGIGLKVGQTFRPKTFLDFGYGLMSCPTLREALVFNRTYQAVNQKLGKARLEVDGDIASIQWHSSDEAEYARPSTEMVLTGYIGVGKWITLTHGEEILAMRFRHRRPAHADFVEHILECPVYYDEPLDQLQFDARLADAPMPGANPQLVEHLSRRLDKVLESIDRPDSISLATYRMIERSLADGGATIPLIARQMGMSDRTLRRRLAGEGETFRDLLAKVRRDVCEIYLNEPDRTMSEIAQLLGYSEHSAFIRAFRGWFGVTPTEYLGRRQG